MFPGTQQIPVEFSGGLNSKISSFKLQQPYLDTADNVRYNLQGQIDKRPGFTNISRNIQGGGLLDEGFEITTFRDELIVFDGENIYAYNQEEDVWINRGSAFSTINEQYRIINTKVATQSNPDATTFGQYTLYAYEDNRTIPTNGGGVRSARLIAAWAACTAWPELAAGGQGRGQRVQRQRVLLLGHLHDMLGKSIAASGSRICGSGLVANAQARKFQASTASLVLPAASNCPPNCSAMVRRCGAGSTASKGQRHFSPSRYSPRWNRWLASNCSRGRRSRGFCVPAPARRNSMASSEFLRAMAILARPKQAWLKLLIVSRSLTLVRVQFQDFLVMVSSALSRFVQTSRYRPRRGSSGPPAARGPVRRPLRTARWRR